MVYAYAIIGELLDPTGTIGYIIAAASLLVGCLFLLYGFLLYSRVKRKMLDSMAYGSLRNENIGRNPMKRIFIVAILCLACFVGRAVILFIVEFQDGAYSPALFAVYFLIVEIFPLMMMLYIFDPATSSAKASQPSMPFRISPKRYFKRNAADKVGGSPFHSISAVDTPGLEDPSNYYDPPTPSSPFTAITRGVAAAAFVEHRKQDYSSPVEAQQRRGSVPLHMNPTFNSSDQAASSGSPTSNMPSRIPDFSMSSRARAMSAGVPQHLDSPAGTPPLGVHDLLAKRAVSPLKFTPGTTPLSAAGPTESSGVRLGKAYPFRTPLLK
eukprot:CAMPEP_0175127254 /NCGR_PEP_ID=MMETSP0087-20121206/4293_1 /TAXON_ID=136419 /ORGANISM="Unknown Unknown, Strain D1" /LENGTH=324 /DNA_ID=CAMNT_0016409229 /DNA_START=387 /DNA_END=1361 /DNA_ORIENTATION=-